VNKITQDIEKLRKITYDILINHFEAFLRTFIISEILIKNFGNKWRDQISKTIITRIKKERKIDINTMDIHDFFQELYLFDLRKIINRHYELATDLYDDLTKTLFIELMKELNKIRRKVAHVNENFCKLDLDNTKAFIRIICKGKAGKEMINFLDKREYEDLEELNSIKIVTIDDRCINNIPPADYDLDGGFIGRKSEIKDIKKRLYSNLDRIITVMGAGGVGKTALALEVAKSLIDDPKNPFKAVIWFSAKDERLTDIEIVQMEPQIKDLEQLINDILEIIDKSAYENFHIGKVPIESYIDFLYEKFSKDKFLLIIDNLESILSKEPLIKFIEDVPCKVLITSRWGLGKLERPISLKELDEVDSINLFKHVVKAKEVEELIKLNDTEIAELVNKVKRYPLALKWSIGQYILGKEINDAFQDIFKGESLIAQFSFDNIFSLFEENEKLVLYSITLMEKPISREMIKFLTDLTDQEIDLAIRRLLRASFIYLTELNTKYSLLSLTSGFINLKLNKNEKLRVILQDRKFRLLELMEGEEKLRSSHYSLISSLGIKTLEEKIAFEHVKQAKEISLIKKNNEEATKLFDTALVFAPKLGYVYEEYSKFEFYRAKNKEKALDLAKKSLLCEPENFHLWFNYGKMLRMAGYIQKSIAIYKKAIELNPQYIPTINQLAKSYSINGDFEKAEDQLKLAKEKKNEQDIQSYLITLNFMVENYLRWTESLIIKAKYENLLRILKKAIKLVKEMLEIDPNNRFISPQRKKILELIEKYMNETKRNMEIYKKLKNLKDLI